MASSNLPRENKQGGGEMYTRDGSVDFYGRPALVHQTGKWTVGAILLINQGLATLAFFGVAVNLVLFLTRVLLQDNAEAANNVSKWTGTVYLFSLVGALLSDSYWGRYKTCVIFQGIFVIGLVGLSVSTYTFLLRPKGCGNQQTDCGSHSSLEIGLFYLFTYMIALGNGGYQPNVATFGADQFDEENVMEASSKVTFFSYFYLAMNLGSLFSNTILDYFEDKGLWTLGFWASTGSAFAALVLFLAGTSTYRHFKPGGNPFSRFCQVFVASAKKSRVQLTPGEYALYESVGEDESSLSGTTRILYTNGFKFLDKAAVITSWDFKTGVHNPWRLCSISQVEEVKCILRLLPIWLCTIIYSVVFTQMASLFVEQGAAMKNKFSGFQIPPASMSSFDILSVALFILLYHQVISPLASKIRGTKSKGLTELQRMGIGLVMGIMAMIAAGLVEYFRLKYTKDCKECDNSSSLSIFWQIPQYAFVGASEVFMYVGQLEFFNAETPAGLKSFGSALCMTSMSFGNYMSSLIVTIVMKISTSGHMTGWIPENLNDGHLDRFYFLLAILTGLDLIAYICCAKWYNNSKLEAKFGLDNEESDNQG